MAEEGNRTKGESSRQPRAAIGQSTINQLKDDALHCTRAGRWLFLIAIVTGIGLVLLSYHLTGVYVQDLRSAKMSRTMLALLVVRGALFGGLSASFLYGIFTVGNAYIDQATRFRKRLYSAYMLNYAFATFTEEIKEGKVTMDDMVRLFQAWNSNVDSAFSRVAFQRASKNVVIGNGRLSVEDPPEHGHPDGRHERQGNEWWPGSFGFEPQEPAKK